MNAWWVETLAPVFGLLAVFGVCGLVLMSPWWRRFVASRPPHRDALYVERSRPNSVEFYLEQRRKAGAEAIRAHAKGDQ